MKPFCWYPRLVGAPRRAIVVCPSCGTGYSFEVMSYLNVIFKQALGQKLPKVSA